MARSSSPTPAPAHGRVRITVLGWLIALEGAAMVATVLFQPRPLGAVLGCAMGAALLANLLLARLRLRGLAGEWMLPRPVHVDDEVALAAVLRAPGGSGPLRLAPVGAQGGGYRGVASLAAAAAAGSRASWTARFPRRGAWTLPPLEARSDQPFGLAEARRSISPAAELIVLPAIGGLRRALRHRLGEWLESAASGLDRGEDELSHLRPF